MASNIPTGVVAKPDSIHSTTAAERGSEELIARLVCNALARVVEWDFEWSATHWPTSKLIMERNEDLQLQECNRLTPGQSWASPMFHCVHAKSSKFDSIIQSMSWISGWSFLRREEFQLVIQERRKWLDDLQEHSWGRCATSWTHLHLLRPCQEEWKLCGRGCCCSQPRVLDLRALVA